MSYPTVCGVLEKKIKCDVPTNKITTKCLPKITSRISYVDTYSREVAVDLSFDIKYSDFDFSTFLRWVIVSSTTIKSRILHLQESST
jgi:hypothetical protein